jgi:acetoin:2,6-dichlorophenolindophenol oxidoreductase subunit beta
MFGDEKIMGSKTVAETIKEITFRHLTQGNGLLLGESISAVGWVNNTVPDCQGIVELPMTDVAGAGIAVGTALVGRRPIFVIRFQDFLILNGSPLIFYAAKLKELHGRSAPIFVRAIASDGLGPVHSGVLHSIFMHFPGFRVCSPMTPREYEDIWADYMNHDDPMIVSEHRESYANKEELQDIIHTEKADITLYGISSARFQLQQAAARLEKDGYKCNAVHLCWLKPFNLTRKITEPLCNSSLGLVVDAGYEIAGAAQAIACQLSRTTGVRVEALGLLDKTKCLCPPLQNRTPDAEKIYAAAKEYIKKKGEK